MVYTLWGAIPNVSLDVLLKVGVESRGAGGADVPEGAAEKCCCKNAAPAKKACAKKAAPAKKCCCAKKAAAKPAAKKAPAKKAKK